MYQTIGIEGDLLQGVANFSLHQFLSDTFFWFTFFDSIEFFNNVWVVVKH